MSKIIILGGAGFLGANCVRYFREAGHTVHAFDNLVRRGSEMNLPEFKRLGVEFFHGDVRNKEDFVTLQIVFAALIQESTTPPLG